MSAMEQRTLNGGVVDRQRPPENGFAVVLYHATPDTDWNKLAAWYRRLDAEGLV